MARPQKQGLDYFSLDCFNDEKMELIEAEFSKTTGFAVIVKLWRWIYRRGFYCDWNEEVALLFACNECGLGVNVVSEVIKSALKRGIFDQDLFQKYSILTSRGIQKRYFEATARRKNLEVKSKYLLVDVAQKIFNVHDNAVNADINRNNDCSNSQKKRKEKKENEIKKTVPASVGLLLITGEEMYVGADQVLNYEKQFPEIDVRRELLNMKNWLENNPKGRRSIGKTRRFIENWFYREKERIENESKINSSRRADTARGSAEGYSGTTVL